MIQTSNVAVLPIEHSRVRAARKVYVKLRRAEETIDQAVVAVGELVATMPAAAQEAALSTLYGQSSLEKVLGSLRHLGEARRAMGGAHTDLGAVKRETMSDYSPEDDFGGGEKPSGLLAQGEPA